jgi:hypothetical protein
LSLIHPHRRRLPRHARHLIKQMLRPRVAMRAGTLHVHAKQLDSAVNLREYPDRLHPDSDRHAPGVRVVVGPETRSLLRQLLESRDMRVQQQLVREIVHQLQKRMVAAIKRARRMKKAREMAGKAARGVRRSRLWGWFRSLPSRAKALATGRTTRTVGNRKPATRTRTVSSRTRTTVGDGRAARTKPAGERTTRSRTTRT